MGMVGITGRAGMTCCTVGTGRRNTKNMSSAAISSTALMTTMRPYGTRRVLGGPARPVPAAVVGASGGTTGSGAPEIRRVNSLGPALAFTSGAAPPSAERGVAVPLLKMGGGRMPSPGAGVAPGDDPGDVPRDGAAVGPSDAAADGADGGPAAAKSGETCAGGAGGAGGGVTGTSGGSPV